MKTLLMGTRVKLSALGKKAMRKRDSTAHVKEFENCEGVVYGPAIYAGDEWPELEVYWKPSNLHYSYPAKYLTMIRRDQTDVREVYYHNVDMHAYKMLTTMKDPDSIHKLTLLEKVARSLLRGDKVTIRVQRKRR